MLASAQFAADFHLGLHTQNCAQVLENPPIGKVCITQRNENWLDCKKTNKQKNICKYHHKGSVAMS